MYMTSATIDFFRRKIQVFMCQLTAKPKPTCPWVFRCISFLFLCNVFSSVPHFVLAEPECSRKLHTYHIWIWHGYQGITAHSVSMQCFKFFYCGIFYLFLLSEIPLLSLTYSYFFLRTIILFDIFRINEIFPSSL